VELEYNTDEAELTRGEREELVRIAREVIAHAVRHGRPEHMTVSLRCRGDELVVEVTGDTSCFEATTAIDPARRSRLRAMRSRADPVGGRLTARRDHAGDPELQVLV
jgi:signal transduction histidine kinase